MNYILPVFISVASLGAGYLYKTYQPDNQTKQNETKKLEWSLSITNIYSSLAKIEFQPSSGNHTPYKIELFLKNNKKLLEVFNTDTIFLSSNDKDKFKEEIYATITDQQCNEFKTKCYSLEIEKNIPLSSRSQTMKQSFLSLLKKEGSFKLLTCGGCGEGKSTLLKAIVDLLEQELGFVLKEGKREMIKCYNSEQSVTSQIFNLVLSKEIDGKHVEIEIIDCPGFWNNKLADPVKSEIDFAKKILSRILQGRVRSGIDVDLDKRELIEAKLPVTNPISKPNIILYCVKYEKITSSPKARDLFQELNEHAWKKGVPTVLVATALDEGSDYLNKKRVVKDARSFVYTGQEFEEIDQRETDVLFSNYSKPIKSIDNMEVSIIPIVNCCENNHFFLDEVPSRKDLSDFLLYQLLDSLIKSKRFSN